MARVVLWGYQFLGDANVCNAWGEREQGGKGEILQAQHKHYVVRCHQYIFLSIKRSFNHLKLGRV
jgi:hypothetical protein